MIRFRLLFTGENEIYSLVGKFHCFTFAQCHFFADTFYFSFGYLMEINSITGIVKTEERNQFQRFFLCRIDATGISKCNQVIVYLPE